MAKKLLITGGSGDLGRALGKAGLKAGYEVTATYLSRPERLAAGTPLALDLTERDAVAIALDKVAPDLIIHTAVPPLSTPNLRQNIIAAAYNLQRLNPRSTRLIFISTDMVFDGQNPPYADDQLPSPLSVYGQAKAEMEMIGDFVVRTSLIYDFAPPNRQLEWMQDRINKGEKIKLFSDEYRSAIWSVNLAEALLELAESHAFKGVINVAGPQSISRLELGWQLLSALGQDPEQWVEPASAAEIGRPADLTLDEALAIWQTANKTTPPN
jgi:dTDP-4-dehydrorhamnose reductase